MRLFGLSLDLLKRLRIGFIMASKKNSAAVALGKLGGKTKGKSKVRGDSEYYRKLAAKRKGRTS